MRPLYISKHSYLLSKIYYLRMYPSLAHIQVRAWGCLHCTLISHWGGDLITRNIIAVQTEALCCKIKEGGSSYCYHHLERAVKRKASCLAHKPIEDTFFIFQFFLIFQYFFLFRVRLRPTHPLPNNYWIFWIFLIGQDPLVMRCFQYFFIGKYWWCIGL